MTKADLPVQLTSFIGREHETTQLIQLLYLPREFGLEQLDQTNELETIQRAHAEYYLTLAEEAELYLTGGQ